MSKLRIPPPPAGTPGPNKARKVKRNRKRTCGGKVRYRDQAEAQAVIKTIQTYSDRTRRAKRAYECLYCNGWHVTSKTDTGGRVGRYQPTEPTGADPAVQARRVVRQLRADGLHARADALEAFMAPGDDVDCAA